MTSPLPEDILLHAVTDDGELRVLVATTSRTCRVASLTHDAGPVATLVLGHALTGAALLRATLKSNDRLGLQFDGRGPLGHLVARALPGGDVYGTVANPRAEAEYDDEGAILPGRALGSQGTLLVTRDSGTGTPWTGSVELSTGRIADEISHYLITSEQIRSAVGLGLHLDRTDRVAAAGGFLIQVLGGVPEERLERIDARIATIAALGREIADGATAETILQRILGGEPHRILATRSLQYQAPQDRNYYLLRLASLSRGDIDQVFEGDSEVEIVCEFTRERHRFTRAEVERTARSLMTLE